jgi:cytochrome P450
VICELLGIPHDGAEEFFVSATRAMMEAASATPDLVRQRVQEAVAYVNGLVELKQRELGTDLLSGLVRNMEPDGPVDRSEMVGVVAVLMFGGYETTSNTLALTLLLTLLHRDQMSRLRADPALVKAAVEEALRYTSVLHTGLPRRATEDVMVGDRLIRAGEGVVVALSSANRDAAAFRSPDEFDLERFAGSREAHHLAFGYGVHQCLGQMLARTQIQMTLSTILERMPAIELAKPVEELSFRHDMFIYGLHELPVTW